MGAGTYFYSLTQSDARFNTKQVYLSFAQHQLQFTIMTKTPRVLVIDDEEQIVDLVRDLLSDSFDVSTALDGKTGLQKADELQPDLILIDNIMPIMSGIETARLLRKLSSTQNIPIIMLTALHEPDDRMAAFNSGVDDFISKPFHPDELISRINAKIQRFQSLRGLHAMDEILIDNLRMSISKRTVYVDGHLIHLTNTEFEILKILMLNQGQIQSREELTRNIWQDEKTEQRVLDSHLVALRKKLKRSRQKITTVYGKGYVIRD